MVQLKVLRKSDAIILLRTSLHSCLFFEVLMLVSDGSEDLDARSIAELYLVRVKINYILLVKAKTGLRAHIFVQL